MNLHSFLLINPWIDSEETLIGIALMIYAVYNYTNQQRHTHSRPPQAERYNALTQLVMEGVRGHSKSIRILDHRWSTRPPPPTQLPKH